MADIVSAENATLNAFAHCATRFADVIVALNNAFEHSPTLADKSRNLLTAQKVLGKIVGDVDAAVAEVDAAMLRPAGVQHGGDAARRALESLGQRLMAAE